MKSTRWILKIVILCLGSMLAIVIFNWHRDSKLNDAICEGPIGQEWFETLGELRKAHSDVSLVIRPVDRSWMGQFRCRCAILLAKNNASNLVESLTAMLKSDDQDATALATFAISEMARVRRDDLASHRAEIIERLSTLVKNGVCLNETCNALGKLDAVEAVPVLVELLHSKEIIEQFYARDALLEIGRVEDEQTLSDLSDLLNSSDKNVREAAEEILKRAGKPVIPGKPKAAVQKVSPLRKAKVGDWASYAVKTKTAMFSMEHESKQIVTAVTETGIIVQSTSIMNGQEIKAPPETVSFDDRCKLMKPPQAGMFKESPMHEEQLVVCGNKMNTQCAEYDVSMPSGGKQLAARTKIWTNTERVPVFGLVKYETETGEASLRMELKEFGWGK